MRCRKKNLIFEKLLWNAEIGIIKIFKKNVYPKKVLYLPSKQTPKKFFQSYIVLDLPWEIYDEGKSRKSRDMS